jgi:ribosomal protein S18 acetylase RimI-like enzyme
METFRGKHIILPKSKNWKLIDETDKYSFEQRLRCKMGTELSPRELWDMHPKWTYYELLKNTKMCTLYPFPIGMKVLDMFKPKRWLDPTAGWGDRLRCAIEYGCEYVGVDSNKSLQKAYTSIIQDKAKDKSKYKVICSKFQDAEIKGKFDLVFTSPPFYTKEVYEHMIHWKSVDEFTHEFLFPMLDKACLHLDNNGHLVLYIEDSTEEEFINIMKTYALDKLHLTYEGAFYYEGSKPRPYYVWKKINKQVKKDTLHVKIGGYKEYTNKKIVLDNSSKKKTSIGKLDYFASGYENNILVGSLRVKHIDNSYVIREVFVIPEKRGLGYGKILVSKILDFLKNKKLPIYLYVDPENMVALELYKKLGFKLIKKNDLYGDKYSK